MKLLKMSENAVNSGKFKMGGDCKLYEIQWKSV